MRRLVLGFLLVIVPTFSSAGSYLEKFQQFMLWNLNFPTNATPEFIAFIQQPTPLSQRLRERWLYQLVRQKDWAGFLKYYLPSADVSLQCYAARAKLYQGQEAGAKSAATRLWLQNTSLPHSCDELFNWLLAHHDPQQHLITERLRIALDNRNLGLAIHLLNRYKPPRASESLLLQRIAQNPTRITSLSPGPLHSDFYLYGLKHLISTNQTNQAISSWQLPIARRLLSEKQDQQFLVFLVVYKAMRNSEDTNQWFAKIKPHYYTDLLLDWTIRYALKHHQWQRVATLIRQSPQKNEPCWQYWLARANEALGKTELSTPIYQTLARSRHYYGFLASLRLHIKPQFENESSRIDLQRLKPYLPITNQVKSLYNAHQVQQASRLINDFASELPKADKSAFVQWIHQDLKWPAKAVALSNIGELNNQLSLRFPLAYQHDVVHSSSRYHIPPALIYAVIRQESGFREDVISPAGAHGLMQLLPTTAQKVAQEKKIPYRNKNQLFLTNANISIGTAYLQQLAQRFHNHPILMAAAYNAGPSQVNRWLKSHTTHPIDIWIDTLPWRETRNYLKNIIAFYAVYQYRLNQTPDLSWFMGEFKQ